MPFNTVKSQKLCRSKPIPQLQMVVVLMCLTSPVQLAAVAPTDVYVTEGVHRRSPPAPAAAHRHLVCVVPSCQLAASAPADVHVTEVAHRAAEALRHPQLHVIIIPVAVGDCQAG